MVTKDFNLGTIVTIVLFLIAQTSAGIWWAATMSADVGATRAWQIRQDDRLLELEVLTDDINRNQARIETLLQVLREEQKETSELILDELRGRE